MSEGRRLRSGCALLLWEGLPVFVSAGVRVPKRNVFGMRFERRFRKTGFVMEKEQVHGMSREVRLTVSHKGPILVFGTPLLVQRFAVAGGPEAGSGVSEGMRYATDYQPTALCRCGASQRKPYCDGAHMQALWNPALIASAEKVPVAGEAESGEEPELVLMEYPARNVSGGIWVRGGIPVRTQEGVVYARPGRLVLCRCGASKNKPFCDGAHAAVNFRDGLGPVPDERK